MQILCTLTSDETKASSYLFGVKPTGDMHFSQVHLPSYRPYRSELCPSSIDPMRPKSNEWSALWGQRSLKTLKHSKSSLRSLRRIQSLSMLYALGTVRKNRSTRYRPSSPLFKIKTTPIVSLSSQAKSSVTSSSRVRS